MGKNARTKAKYCLFIPMDADASLVCTKIWTTCLNWVERNSQIAAYLFNICPSVLCHNAICAPQPRRHSYRTDMLNEPSWGIRRQAGNHWTPSAGGNDEEGDKRFVHWTSGLGSWARLPTWFPVNCCCSSFSCGITLCFKQRDKKDFTEGHTANRSYPAMLDTAMLELSHKSAVGGNQ